VKEDEQRMRTNFALLNPKNARRSTLKKKKKQDQEMQLDLRGAGITMIAALGRGHERCSRKP